MSHSFDDRQFRDALSAFATGVTIVTAAHPETGEPVGMTASSFNSVSMAPPLILWSVNKSALSAEIFRHADNFAVHVLASDQTETANRFAQKGIDKFADSDISLNARKVPILSGAAARFDCARFAVYEGGDHWIIVGQVEELDCQNKKPLVFAQGSYAIAQPLQLAASALAADGREEPTNPIDQSLFYHISRAYHQISEHFHQSVRESGLTIPEWRILASLHGGAEHERGELSARTFVHPKALQDRLAHLEAQGLCSIETRGEQVFVIGTKSGHERIQNLLDLSAEQEKKALDDSERRADLMESLRVIIQNTNSQ